MASSDQKPVGSGFKAKTPAKKIIEGTDLTGKIAVVTGGYSGIGIETVRALVSAGASVVVPSRRRDVAEQALADLSEKVVIVEMDLGDIDSVRKFATGFVETGRPLDFLINNAGIMACPLSRVGSGWESQFGINHLGHFELARKLTPALLQSDKARIVALSSSAHIRGDVLWDDPHFEQTEYDKWQAYAQAKSANALFALGYDRIYRDRGVRAFSVHPGGILTPLQRHLDTEEMVALGWMQPDGTLTEIASKLFKTPEEGASTTIWAATSSQLEGRGGVYCEDCDIAPLASEKSLPYEHVREWACDDENADRLWAMSERMIDAA